MYLYIYICIYICTYIHTPITVGKKDLVHIFLMKHEYIPKIVRSDIGLCWPVYECGIIVSVSMW